MLKKMVAIGIVLLSAGCVQPYYGPGAVASRPQGAGMATQDQTAGTENQDRINRFQRLAAMQGTMAPSIEQLSLPPNSVSYMAGPVPVVRVVFSERAFFDSNSDIPRPEAGPILDLIAENMRRDVGDAALTVLGHTDAVGTDAYNIDLSRRRAGNVMAALVQRGVNPDQLSEVAIGKAQPIAPNDTPDGRARNRRVEFLISSGMDANLAAVQQRSIRSSYLSLADGRAEPVHAAVLAQVLRMKPAGQDRVVLATPGRQTPAAAGEEAGKVDPGPGTRLSQNPIGLLVLKVPSNDVHLLKPDAPQPVHLLPLDTVNGTRLEPV